MDNFGPVPFRMVMLIMLKTFVAESRKVQMVATRDIGRLAAEAFEQPDRYIGRAIELAGDAVTRAELVEALRANGRRPTFSFRVPGWLQGKIPEECKLMMRWIAEEGFQADIPALHREHPDLLTVRQWAAQSAAEATGSSGCGNTHTSRKGKSTAHGSPSPASSTPAGDPLEACRTHHAALVETAS